MIHYSFMFGKDKKKIRLDAVPLFIGIVLVTFGMLLFCGTIGRNLSCHQEVIAKVTDVRVDETMYWKGALPHYPSFTYIVDGVVYTVESKEYTRNMNKYIVGQKMIIWCNPNKPEEIRLGLSIGGIFVASVPILVGGILIYVYLRYR